MDYVTKLDGLQVLGWISTAILSSDAQNFNYFVTFLGLVTVLNAW